MNILDKDEAWTMYNEFFLEFDDDDVEIPVFNELKWEDAADSATQESDELRDRYLNEFNNLYGLLMDIVLECEQQISSDDEIECKASYLSQMANNYDYSRKHPEKLRKWYAEGRMYKESKNRFVELTVEQTRFIALMGSIIIDNCWLELRSHNEGKE